ncbi:hypothetical protein E1263_08265 [Kribbella antibiotica]|uniref:Uncharacterized protein n=1 Tax=Kribbella antibiotica TaxID=190195 RepID=A0A4R4ZQD8_9ACTN|nr:hypothetical protein [Kribbella antibiotica]TDD61171.1 hypothetical protein E1263_08265 [Kribbella antibiotica]
MYVILGAMVVTMVVLWLARGKIADSEVRRLVARGGLPAEEGLVEPAKEWFRQRQTILVLGILAGTVAAGVVLAVADAVLGGKLKLGPTFGSDSFEFTVDLRLWLWFLAITAAWSGAATLLHGYRAVRLARVDGPRAAALRPRKLTDYLHPIEIAIYYVIVLVPLICVGLGIVVLGSADQPERGWVLVVSGAIGVLLWGGGVVVQRLALGVSQRSGRPEELLWQEALRATTLRDIGTAMITVSWLLGAGVPFSFSWPSDVPTSFEWMGWGLLMGALLLSMVASAVAHSPWGLPRVRRVVG